ncbi:type II secretion system F family protein [Symbiobacterium terraclitae]|uniref:type II secretion system F family protein n=1 Tax=Symbiobacterium terraclitae TaxID=557451 RepID=UPI0035B55768
MGSASTLAAALMWFAAAYLLLAPAPSAHTLRALLARGALDDQVQLLLHRSERTTRLADRLQRLLLGSTLGSYLSIAQFGVLSLVIAVVLATLALLLLRNPLAAGLLAAVGLALPYQLLEIDHALTRRRLRRQGTAFLLSIMNLYAIYPDPLAALEQLAPRLRGQIGRTVRWFTTACRHGLPLPEAIARAKDRMPDPTLQAFWDDVAFYAQRGGPFNEALADHVARLYEREQLAAERSVATGSTISVFLTLMAVYLVLLSNITRINPAIATFMLETTPGHIVVTVMIALFLGGAYYLKHMTLAGGDG